MEEVNKKFKEFYSGSGYSELSAAMVTVQTKMSGMLDHYRKIKEIVGMEKAKIIYDELYVELSEQRKILIDYLSELNNVGRIDHKERAKRLEAFIRSQDLEDDYNIFCEFMYKDYIKNNSGWDCEDREAYDKWCEE